MEQNRNRNTSVIEGNKKRGRHALNFFMKIDPEVATWPIVTNNEEAYVGITNATFRKEITCLWLAYLTYCKSVKIDPVSKNADLRETIKDFLKTFPTSKISRYVSATLASLKRHYFKYFGAESFNYDPKRCQWTGNPAVHKELEDFVVDLKSKHRIYQRKDASLRADPAWHFLEEFYLRDNFHNNAISALDRMIVMSVFCLMLNLEELCALNLGDLLYERCLLFEKPVIQVKAYVRSRKGDSKESLYNLGAPVTIFDDPSSPSSCYVRALLTYFRYRGAIESKIESNENEKYNWRLEAPLIVTCRNGKLTKNRMTPEEAELVIEKVLREHGFPKEKCTFQSLRRGSILHHGLTARWNPNRIAPFANMTYEEVYDLAPEVFFRGRPVDDESEDEEGQEDLLTSSNSIVDEEQSNDDDEDEDIVVIEYNEGEDD